MKKLLASAILLLLCGCPALPQRGDYVKLPRNPMKPVTYLHKKCDNRYTVVEVRAKRKQPWWQADTANITSNSPWEAFIKQRPRVEKPRLFPKDWKHAKKRNEKAKLY